jgi:hypothetical protein
MNQNLIISVLALFSMAAVAIAAEDVPARFEAIFGDQVKQVGLTPDTDDDAALARKLLDGMEALESNHALQFYTATQAAELASRAVRPELVAEAVALADTFVTDEARSEWLARRIDIWQTCYERARGEDRKKAAKAYLAALIQAARDDMEARRVEKARERLMLAKRMARYADRGREDEIAGLLVDLAALERKQAKAEALARRLEANPDDGMLRRELITYYIVVLDQPGKAAELADEHLDELYRTNVINLGKPLEKIEPAALASLAEWMQLAIVPEAEDDKTRVRLLRQTIDVYEAFLAKADGNDPAAVRAKVELADLRERLAKIEGGALASKAALLMTFDKDTVKQQGNKVAIRDLSTNRNHGLGTGVTFQEGIAGNCAVFDGKTHVRIANDKSLQITGDQTIAMWLKPSALGARRNPLNKSYGAECTWTLEENGTVNYYFGSAGKNDQPYQGVTSGRIRVGHWSHLTVVRDTKAGVVRWYVNGRPSSAERMKVKPSASTLPLVLGQGYVEPYVGNMDEVVIFPEAISGGDVKTLCDLGKVGRSLQSYKP